MTTFQTAEVESYKALMLPSEGIAPSHLQSIKRLFQTFLQRQVNEALHIFSSADERTAFDKANQAQEIAMKRLKGC